jgi:D-glycerate 3-kinase
MNMGSLERRFRGFIASLPRVKTPLVIGLAGAQGSGKSTLSRKVAEMLVEEGRMAATVSIDDFYFGRSNRRRLAGGTHPLFVTRGPPGTHDVSAAIKFVDAVKAGREAIAPKFDKLADERFEGANAAIVKAPFEVLIFEGWCLGARPEPESDLEQPINTLEREFDARGSWRRAVNSALGDGYQALFQRFDRLVYLRPPRFEIVAQWRLQQEETLAASATIDDRHKLMRPDEIAYFIQHYERITRRMMIDLPGRADLTIQLDEKRRPIGEIAAQD